MLAFFYSLFRALLTGRWDNYTLPQVNNVLEVLLNKLSQMIVNALGGNFETIQTFDIVTSGVTPLDIFAAISSVVALVLVCTLTFKLVKQVFSIFFGGR